MPKRWQIPAEHPGEIGTLFPQTLTDSATAAMESPLPMENDSEMCSSRSGGGERHRTQMGNDDGVRHEADTEEQLFQQGCRSHAPLLCRENRSIFRFPLSPWNTYRNPSLCSTERRT
jgi:hypothetical protein